MFSQPRSHHHHLSLKMSRTNAIDLTKARSRMAHPGGKLSSNKEKAQAKFLARLRKTGTENLSTTQRLALSRIPGGAVLLRETYGIPSSSSSSSSSSFSFSSSASFHKQNRNKTKKQNRQKGGNSTNHNKRQHSKFQNNNNNNNNNNSNNQQTTARLSSKKRKKGASSVFVPNKKSSRPDLTAKLNMSLDDLC